MTRSAPDCSEAQFGEAMEDSLDYLAPELISDVVRNLNGWTKSRAYRPPTRAPRPVKSGEISPVPAVPNMSTSACPGAN